MSEDRNIRAEVINEIVYWFDSGVPIAEEDVPEELLSYMNDFMENRRAFHAGTQEGER